jgi:hypothetical protein
MTKKLEGPGSCESLFARLTNSAAAIAIPKPFHRDLVQHQAMAEARRGQKGSKRVVLAGRSPQENL